MERFRGIGSRPKPTKGIDEVAEWKAEVNKGREKERQRLLREADELEQKSKYDLISKNPGKLKWKQSKKRKRPKSSKYRL